MAPAEPLRRQAQPIAIAIAAQQSIRNPRLIASEPTSRTDGQAASFPAKLLRPIQVPKAIMASRQTVEISATKMDRVTIQCLGTGRASTRSMNPFSISITGIVASVTEIETSAPITTGWKYPRQTIPLNVRNMVNEGPKTSRANEGIRSAIFANELEA